MANPPFRRGPKIGRSDPCFCGSGLKFKHFHGGVQHTLPALFARDKLEKIVAEARRQIEAYKARELQRHPPSSEGTLVALSCGTTRPKGTRDYRGPMRTSTVPQNQSHWRQEVSDAPFLLAALAPCFVLR